MGIHPTVDEAAPVEDFTPETLGELGERIACSTTPEQLVYREAELDDLWRIVETAVTVARDERLPAAEIARLEHLARLVRDAHDLVGHGRDAAPGRAVQLLMLASGA
jgi:hypothetical protein